VFSLIYATAREVFSLIYATAREVFSLIYATAREVFSLIYATASYCSLICSCVGAGAQNQHLAHELGACEPQVTALYAICTLGVL
jgi:hypothetical protein